MSANITRRMALKAASAVGAALGLPLAAAASVRHDQRDEMIALIHDLEAYQGWAPYNIVAAKAWAAYRMRLALGLPLPDPQLAREHCDMQRAEFEGWRRTMWFERAVAEGKAIAPAEVWPA